MPSFLIDTHAHFHPCYNLLSFLENTYRNFQESRKIMGLSEEHHGIICLMDCGSKSAFQNVFQGKTGEKLSCGEHHWRITATQESRSLKIIRNDTLSFFILAGKQIVTEENLEVLALGTCSQHTNGKSLTATIEAVLQDNAIPILPWGVGKWLGRRGNIIKEFLQSEASEKVFLGDNSGRLRYLPYPTLFSLAEKNGVFILPGSDPLPLPYHSKKAGSFGVILEMEMDQHYPEKMAKEALSRIKSCPKAYGNSDGLFPFLYNQTMMQLRKKIPYLCN